MKWRKEIVAFAFGFSHAILFYYGAIAHNWLILIAFALNVFATYMCPEVVKEVEKDESA